jgi:hypothetical protein
MQFDTADIFKKRIILFYYGKWLLKSGSERDSEAA